MTLCRDFMGGAPAGRKSQAALDFMVSYGIVLLVLAIALYVIYQLGILNPQLTPAFCTPAPNFSCISYSVLSNGTFTFVFAQTSGGTLSINGVACSSSVNGTGNGPEYGNVHVLGYAGGPLFYPNNQLSNGITLGGDQPKEISVYCYRGSGLATGNLGTNFIGYVWINYTYSNLPSSYHVVQQVAAFSTAYT